jgi:hypothetical protein
MKIKIALLLSFLVLLAGCTKYVPFQQLKYDPIAEEYVAFTDFSEDYINNILYTLDYFGFDQKYFMINGKLYITKELWEDKVLLLAYCSIANDSKWINSRTDKRTKKTRWAMKTQDTNILKRFRYRP